MPPLSAGAGAACALLLSACSAATTAGPPTYHDDVAPMLERSCLPCHGARSPHSLASYDELAVHAERALELMRAGVMPKGNVDRSGACGELSGPAPVSAADVELFAEFLAQGMHEGEPASVAARELEPAFRPDVTLEPSEPYLPATDADGGSGDHRCFVVQGPTTHAAALAAFRVRPALPEVVHHVMLFALDAESDREASRRLDLGAAGAGWPCFGTPGVAGARLIGVWTPGQDVVRLPEGYATRLGRAGLLMQVHYDGPAAWAPDRTRVELELADDGARELRFVPFAALDLLLPPGRETVRSAYRGRLAAEAGSEILGAYPHMHALGQRLSLHARLAPDDDVTCVVSAPRWDYAFQELALYRAPLLVEGADPELAIECEHSTLGVRHTVTWGERMEDEMCMAFLALSSP